MNTTRDPDSPDDPSAPGEKPAMNAQTEHLLQRFQSLPPEHRAEVENFVDFLATKSLKQAAFDRLLAIAPALEAAGVKPLTEQEMKAEVKAARAERLARSGAD